MKRKLFIYGTIFNNSLWVRDSIKSIQLLKPAAIYICDNFSTDGTYELLKNLNRRYKNIYIVRVKSSRGKGRQVALDLVYKASKNTDLAMYVDFDTIYKKPYLLLIQKLIEAIKGKEVSIGMLATIKTNKLCKFKNLNAAEDVERYAHFIALGCKLIDVPKTAKQYKNLATESIKGNRLISRELYYSKNPIRLVRWTIDLYRGHAYDNYKNALTDNASQIIKLLTFFAFLMAKVIGTYRYNENLDNRSLITHKSEYRFLKKRITISSSCFIK